MPRATDDHAEAQGAGIGRRASDPGQGPIRQDEHGRREYGRRWTTRIIVLPGDPLVKTGPYSYLSHPNYLVVIGEIAALSLCLGLPLLALVFSIANIAILSVRIRAENAALTGLRDVAHT